MTRARRNIRGVVSAVCWALVGAAGCSKEEAPVTRSPRPGTVIVVAQPTAERLAAQDVRRGVGWYPNVEVDATDRVHISYVDADAGDVLYAASAPGGVQPETPQPVDTDGATGSFLRMAIAPGGVPVLLYYQQDEHTLRIAYRPGDLPALKQAGGDVDLQPADAKVAAPGAPGWVHEEIAFGDDVGVGGALAVDDLGRVHAVYYVHGDRLRSVRRPSSVPAFGAQAAGHWEKIDIDSKAGESPNLITDVQITRLPSGLRREVVSYCNWQLVHGHLMVALRTGDEPVYTLTQAREQQKSGIDGIASAVLPNADGTVDIAAVRLDDSSVQVGRFDPSAPAPLAERHAAAWARGPAQIRRAANGTLYVLTRNPHGSERDPPGLYLVEVSPQGAAVRTLLEAGTADDAWLDLALTQGGKPVAVWFSESVKGVKLYAD